MHSRASGHASDQAACHPLPRSKASKSEHLRAQRKRASTRCAAAERRGEETRRAGSARRTAGDECSAEGPDLGRSRIRLSSGRVARLTTPASWVTRRREYSARERRFDVRQLTHRETAGARPAARLRDVRRPWALAWSPDSGRWTAGASTSPSPPGARCRSRRTTRTGRFAGKQASPPSKPSPTSPRNWTASRYPKMRWKIRRHHLDGQTAVSSGPCERPARGAAGRIPRWLRACYHQTPATLGPRARRDRTDTGMSRGEHQTCIRLLRAAVTL